MVKDVQWSIIYNSKKSEWIQIPDGRKMTFLFLFLFFTMWEIQVTEYGDYRRVFHLYGEMLRIYVNTEWIYIIMYSMYVLYIFYKIHKLV